MKIKTITYSKDVIVTFNKNADIKMFDVVKQHSNDVKSIVVKVKKSDEMAHATITLSPSLKFTKHKLINWFIRLWVKIKYSDLVINLSKRIKKLFYEN